MRVIKHVNVNSMWHVNLRATGQRQAGTNDCVCCCKSQ